MGKVVCCRVGLVFAAASLLLGCSQDTRRQNETSTDTVAPSRSEDQSGTPYLFEARLLEIARDYQSYGRLDSVARWGNALCIPITACTFSGEPTLVRPRFSESGDAGTHGRKLYSLFVRDASAYRDTVLGGMSSPVGQEVVKESWLPEEVADRKEPDETVVRTVRTGDLETKDAFRPYAWRDGRLYHARERGPLFILFKMDPSMPGTDAGWVYGTVTADSRKVLSAGRVESCMACHQKAPHDRLFGPKNE
jgi:hypothetical protein